MVETEHSSEPLGAFDDARKGFGANGRLDQPIVDPLMIPLPVIVRGVLASGLSQRPFAEEHHPIETLILDRPDEALGVGVQVGRAVGQTHDFDASILQENPERVVSRNSNVEYLTRCQHFEAVPSHRFRLVSG